jgi:IS4 transposase
MNLLEQSLTDWAATLTRHGDPIETHMIEIAQHKIGDPADRKFFNQVSTSLQLDDDSVDRLIAIGRSLLRDSPEFRKVVSQLQ